MSIPPQQVAVNRRFLFFVAAVVRVVQRKLLQRAEVALDAVQPRCIRRREVESHVVTPGPAGDVAAEVRAVVVQNDVQPLRRWVTPTHPLQETQEVRRLLVLGHVAIQPVGLEVVVRQEVSHAELAAVGSPIACDLTIASLAEAVSRLEIERAELVDADYAAAFGRAFVQPADGPVLAVEVGIVRFFPGFRASPADAALPQQGTQMLDADRGHHALFDQVLPQLRQRPLVHADQLLGRRQHDLNDPFDEIGEELAWLAGVVLVERIPGDAVDPLGIEAVDDDSYPLRRAVGQRGDVAVGHAAGREQDDSCVSAIDLAGQLSFHLVQLPPFIRPELSCSNLIQLRSPRNTFACVQYVETSSIAPTTFAQALYSQIVTNLIVKRETLQPETALESRE